MPKQPITTLFLDIGNVFLSNGWDHHMREAAAKHFELDYAEMNARHGLTFDTYEIGKISLETYLNRVVFYKERSFTSDDFKTFMFEQSVARPKMIDIIKKLKAQFGLKTITLSNEGRELMEYRVERFKMKEYIDFYICSAFVGLRKPDLAIYQLALDLAQVTPQESIYIDDRELLVKIARGLGFNAIHHVEEEKTYQQLMDLLII